MRSLAAAGLAAAVDAAGTAGFSEVLAGCARVCSTAGASSPVDAPGREDSSRETDLGTVIGTLRQQRS